MLMSKSITDITEYNCCGCRACEQICPKKAISMIENKNGFLMPFVDDSKCIGCGLCVQSCAFKEPVNKNMPLSVYAARFLNDKILAKSSSGGIFPAISYEILKSKGVVVGCRYNERLKAEHICIEDVDDIVYLQGSKYVQSDTLNTYTKIREYLNCGRTVLFSGTPCQVGGLKKYLRKDYDNLFTIETICHGAPSPKIFAKYLEWLAERFGSKVVGFSFRDKEKKAWGGFDLRVQLENGTVKFIYGQTDPYFVGFFEGRLSRDSCYNCVYATRDRVADLTLGDYWGIEKAHIDFVDPRGVSVVLVNSKKGEWLFDLIKDKIFYVKSDWESAALLNPELKRPAIKPEVRDRFYTVFREENNNEFFSKTLKPGFRLKKRINNIIPFKLRTIIKRIK